MKVSIITLGCKVNIYESEMIKNKFIDAGYKIDDVNPDIIIINTCSVTNNADSKSRKIIRSKRKQYANAILVVCGCMSQNHQEILNDLNIDILIGNKDKSNIVLFVEKFKENKKKLINFEDPNKFSFEDMQVAKFHNKTRGFVKIQDGCNNFCSYCIIPYLRGRCRSKDLHVALKEIENLCNNNHQEIVLTGIHTGFYGEGKDYNLSMLMNEACKIKELKRLRISSIEITEIDDQFLNCLKENPKICNHLHIPLQSGSDKVLKDMNRRYDTAYFLNKLNKIRQIRKDINITTDVIVGFPTETDENFHETLNFCKKAKFSKIHVFPYSKRNGTTAANIKPILNENVKKQRSKELLLLSDKLEKKYNDQFLNKNLIVLVEQNINNETSVGLTDNYLKVHIDRKIETNKMVEVKILSAKSHYVNARFSKELIKCNN